jgi:hypothetical protein
MDRRTRSLRHIAAGVALLVVAGAVHAVVDNRADVAVAAARPNILIIITDDQRDSMGVLPGVRQFFGKGAPGSAGGSRTHLCAAPLERR